MRVLEKPSGQLRLSIITSSEGFVRLGVLVPKPNIEVRFPSVHVWLQCTAVLILPHLLQAVVNLCNVAEGNKDGLATFEGALGVEGPSFVEYQYLMKGFGYSVYKEGFDIIFHYAVGEDRA